jgi:hypothetical protein
MRVIFLILVSISFNSYASWLCREASSRAQGDVFYACGYAESKNLMTAREEALEAAKREFRAFCDESKNCRGHAYTISPMRTDCSLDRDLHKCYRGVEYTILAEKESHIFINKASIKKKIKDKKAELDELQEYLSDVNRLELLNREAEKLKKMDKTEIDLLELKHAYKNYQTLRNVGVFVGIHALPLKDSDSIFAFGVGAEYQHLLWRNIFSKWSIAYVGISGDDKINDRGTPNTKSEIKNHSYSGIDVNLSFPTVFKELTILPNVGFLGVNYKSKQVEYNNFGVGLNETEKQHKYNTGYAGIGLRFGNEAYIGVEPRYYFNGRKISGIVNFGLAINF